VPHRVTEVATIVALVTSGIGEGTLDGYRGRVPRPYDLVIIGLGSAGLTAARFASAELGLRVAAVERDRVGGDCLWSGCVPSKSLARSARSAHEARRAVDFGVRTGEVTVDLPSVWRRIRDVQGVIASGDDSPERLADWGVDLYNGTASVTGARRVRVDLDEGTTDLDTRNILICTGSRARIPHISGLAEVDYLTNETLFALDAPPTSLAVIGGGPFAVESAQALNRLGVDVTLFEALDRLLSRDEPELTARVAEVLRAEGVDVRLSTAVTGVRSEGGDVVVETADGESRAAAVLLATGRTANVEALGLDRLGIAAGPDGISVDARSRTIVSSIYAVGDAAAGRSLFTHSAAHDAVMAVRDMFLPGRGAAATLVPWVTFTDPQLAHVGMTATEARERFGERRVRVTRFDLADTDRARIDSTPEGMVMVVTARGKVVGGHILAPEAGEMIQELALAVRFAMSIRELGEIVHVYPTMSTGISQMVAEHVFRRIRRLRRVAKLSRLMG
jgi:pyruvate/2-oxoglutarate dehydrogenase complex dihydrolipoamide dehydrogenase (E3) component